MTNVAVSGSDSHPADWDALRGTLAELRERRQAWDREVAELFDDFDSLAVQMALKSAVRDSSPASPAPGSSHSKSGHTSRETQPAESTVHELSSIRELVAQQTELITAFLTAASAATPYRPAAVA